MDILRCKLTLTNYQIIAFTETGLSSNFLTAELGFDTYNVFRCDRSSTTSTAKCFGGVLIAVHQSIPARLIETNVDIEQIFVLIGSGNNQKILGCVYIPPNSPLDKYESFSTNLEDTSQRLDFPQFCIMGDFNLPKANWATEDVCSVAYRSEQGYLPPSEIGQIQHISEVCAYHNLFQLNHICNVNNVILDFILSHTLMPITQPDADELAADSNHPPLQYQMNLLHCSGNSEIHGNGYYYDFKSANFTDINNYLGSIPV